MTDKRLAVAAITFDFGNTLVPVGHGGSRSVLAATARGLLDAGLIRDVDEFQSAWVEERDRQFREEVPLFREVDVPQRAVRVLARLRGMRAPAPEDRWDDALAGRLATSDEAELAVDLYSRAFVAGARPVADAYRTLEELATRGFRLAILSNWPIAVSIDRVAKAEGWMPFLHAIVVSQRVGTIKPHVAMFRAAEAALGLEATPSGILHVGDDWAADVNGARGAGWRVAYLRDRQADTPLPTSEHGVGMVAGSAVTADLEIDELSDLDALVQLVDAPAAASARGTA